MVCQRLIFCLLAVVSLGFIATMAQAPTVSVSKFRNVNAPGAIQTDAYAVNNFGVIAGDYVDHGNVQHGMILNGKNLVSVDRANCQTTPGSGAIAFFGINNTSGAQVTVVGWCFDTVQNTDVAFTYSDGNFVTIAPPGTTSTIAQGINDNGGVTGAYVDSGKVQHGFLFNGNTYTTLDVPKHTSPDAWSVNDKGLIAIFAVNSGGHYDSFLFNGKTYKNVDFKAAPDSLIHTIDNSGDRIYTVLDSSGNSHGVFYLAGSGGGFVEFDFPDAAETQASGLSEKLKIVGNYQKNSANPATTGSQGWEGLGCCRPQ